MKRAILAGLGYVTLVFAAGFVLGTIRTVLLVPRLGETAAVMLELPLMLLISWLACGWMLRRFDVPPSWTGRAVMGGLALALLLLAEAALGTLLLGRTLAGHLASYANVPDQLGLAAQVLFGLFPLLMRRAT